MKLLVAHDRANVRDEIVRIIRQSLGNEEAEIVVAGDMRRVRAEVEAHVFDLIILDLTIPYRPQDAAEFGPVINFLDDLYQQVDLGLNVPGDIIGITLEPDVIKNVAADLGSHLMVIIPEDSEGRWKEALSGKVRYAKNVAEARQRSFSQRYSVDLLIATAMDKEAAPFGRIFELHPDPRFMRVNKFFFADKSGKRRVGVVGSVGRSGQPSAASYCQSLVSWYRPKVALMAGYCGGVKNEVELGDLLAFEGVSAWDYGKWVEVLDESGKVVSEHFSARPNPIEISEVMAHHFRSLRDKGLDLRQAEAEYLDSLLPTGGSVKKRPELVQAASGSAVVANTRLVADIRGLNGSIKAVDMEAYGFYYACSRTFVKKPVYGCVKAVSDFCNGEKDDAYHAACCYVSALTVQRLVTGYVEF